MSPNKSDETTYLWENIPRELWNAARAKGMEQRRPMKAVLLELLENWVRGDAAELQPEAERSYADSVDSGGPGGDSVTLPRDR